LPLPRVMGAFALLAWVAALAGLVRWIAGAVIGDTQLGGATMKFLFWNVQRRGSATPEKRGEIIQGVIAEAFDVHHVDCALLCEVSGSTSLGGVSLSKQVAVVRRATKTQAAQLGYASIASDLNEITLEKFPLPKFTEVFG